MDIELKTPIVKPAQIAPSGGLCVGKGELFFPAEERRTKSEVIRERLAIQICRQCPKQEECLMYALHYEMYGIWGGSTERQRHRLRLRHNIDYTKPGENVKWT